MQQSHGIGYKKYSQNLEERLKVEKKRERSYRKSQEVVAEVDRQVHR